MNKTQLLCTFATPEILDGVLTRITTSYTIAFGTIYILTNMDDPEQLCCTYNIDVETTGVLRDVPSGTISLHRKKATNTLYTINALNMLVSELNGGTIDPTYKVNWEDYRNAILVTAYGKFKRINTKLFKIIKTSELGLDSK